jgi:hypothetical protein
MCKSYLRLGSEFQGLSFDSMTAHVAIVMTRYIMLAWEQRHTTDQRTFGAIFFLYYDEAQDIQFQEAFELLLELLTEELQADLGIPECKIDVLLTKMIDTLPKSISTLLKMSVEKCLKKAS